MKTGSIILLLVLISFLTAIPSYDARSIRIKRQSPAMNQFNRRRRDLWEALKKLTIIYKRIRSQNPSTAQASISYIPKSVDSYTGSSNGEQALAVISRVLGPDFPVRLDDIPDAHRQIMQNQVRHSLDVHAPRYRHRFTGEIADGSIQISNRNTLQDSTLRLAKSYGGNGLVLKVVTNEKENGRRNHPRTLEEIIHVCGKINHELRNKSVKLKCEVETESASG